MKKIHYSWYTILVGGLLMFGMSAQQMSQGVFLARVAESLNVGMGTVSLAYSISVLLMIGMSPLAAKLFQKYPVRILSCIAAFLQAVSLVLLSTANSVVTIVIACLIESFSISSFLGVLSSVLIKRWFKDRGQFAYNVILFMSMLGGVVFTPIASAVIEATSWRIAYRVLAGFVLLIEIPITLIFLKESPEQIGLKPYESPGGDKSDAVKTRPSMNAHVTVKSSWRSKYFYMVCFYAVALAYAAMMQNHMGKHLESIGFTSALAGTAISAGMIGGLVGRVSLSFVSEKLSLKTITALYGGIGIVTAIALCFAGNFPAALVVAIGFMSGLACRVSTVQSSMMKYKVFGASDDYARIVANMAIVTGILTSMSSTIYGYIYDATGSYNGGFIIIITTFSIAIVLANILLKNEKKQAKAVKSEAASGQ